jgi:biofilm protein TabA
MILDAEGNAARYTGLHPLFGQAFAWCADPANQAIANGRYPLRGDDLTVIVESGLTSPASARRFESHRRCIDIQVVLTGPEAMEWMPCASLTVSEPFRPGGDICFYAPPKLPATRLLLGPLQFAIFWPEDAHKPCCHPGDVPVPFRKLICKVAVDAR